MLHTCVQKFNVTVTVQTFSQTKRSLSCKLHLGHWHGDLDVFVSFKKKCCTQQARCTFFGNSKRQFKVPFQIMINVGQIILDCTVQLNSIYVLPLFSLQPTMSSQGPLSNSSIPPVPISLFPRTLSLSAILAITLISNYLLDSVHVVVNKCTAKRCRVIFVVLVLKHWEHFS